MLTVIELNTDLLEKAKLKTGIFDTDALIDFALNRYFQAHAPVFSSQEEVLESSTHCIH